MHKLKIIWCVLLTTLVAIPAHAYIGPGAGAGVIATVLGVISSIFLALIALIWYPIKRLFKKFKIANKKTTNFK